MYRILLILLFSPLFMVAQNYCSIDTSDMDKRNQVLRSIKLVQQKFDREIRENYKGKLRKNLQKSYQEFTEEFNKGIREGDFVLNTKLEEYFNKITHEILSQNNLNPKDYSLLISKDPKLNAYTIIDGIIVANLGLFYWLENEDQIAGILSHEISHKILNHSMKSQVAYYEEMDSKENKKLLRDIKKRKYGRQSIAFEIFKKRLYESKEQKRKREIEADSLGYLLLNNTRYQTSEYLNALHLMMVYDSLKPADVKPAVYRKYFDLPEQPFQEDWLNLEDFSDYDYSQYQEKLDEDKLASHPDSQERIAYLKKLFPVLNDSIEYSNSTNNEFFHWRNAALYEQVPYFYHEKQYGQGLYLTLLRLQQEKDNAYYEKWLGRFLEKIVEARKLYKLNRYVESVNPDEQTPSYQLFLNFIWNLSLIELETMANFYSSN